MRPRPVPTSPPAAASHSNARIAALYAQGLVDYLHGRGLDVTAWLPGVQQGGRAGGPNAPDETSLSDWIRLLETATRTLGEPDLPARAGASLQPRHLGALGHVLMSCGDLQDAYWQLARYIRLLGQIGQPELVVNGVGARLLWRWPYASLPPQSVALFMLAARVRFMRWLSDRPALKVDAVFHGPAPGPLAGFEAVFGGSVRFGETCSQLLFPAEFLRLKVVTADQSIRALAEERAQSQLRSLTEEAPLVQSVKRVLASRLASGEVALRDVAAVLNLSARTLQRRLTELEVHYQQLLDEVRADCAADLIRNARLPLAEVAFLLGYRDQSTFQTAYRRWFNTSPGKSRRSAVAAAARRARRGGPVTP